MFRSAVAETPLLRYTGCIVLPPTGRRWTARAISTRPGSESTTTGKVNKDIPPPLLHGQTKSKVNMWPGPVKQKPEQPSLNTNSVPNPPPAAQLSKRRQLPPAMAKEELSVSGMIKFDLKHAQELGVLKSPPPNASALRAGLYIGYQVIKFYLLGVRTIFSRYLDASTIKKRIRRGDTILRTESRFVRLQRQDMLKVFPFVIVAVIAEEIVPFVAIFAPHLLPSTCILPGQQLRIDKTSDERALMADHEFVETLNALRNRFVEDGQLSAGVLATPSVAKALCDILRLPSFGPNMLRRRRITKHLDFLSQDDKLLLAEGWDNLDDTLLKQALRERGFLSQNDPLELRQAQLQWWLDNVKHTRPEEAISRRLYLLSLRE